jgi:hypothetical protein
LLRRILQTRARGKLFPTLIVFPRPLEERAGSPARQTGGYFATRAFSRLCWRFLKKKRVNNFFYMKKGK